MFTVSFYFLGVAIFILAASICLSWARRAGRIIEMDADALRTVSVCLPTNTPEATDRITAILHKELSREENARWNTVRAIWLRWYARCQHEALEKQNAMYSWARTLALSSVLCLIGVLLEAEFDQPITLHTILTGFRRPCSTASDGSVPQCQAFPMATVKRST